MIGNETGRATCQPSSAKLDGRRNPSTARDMFDNDPKLKKMFDEIVDRLVAIQKGAYLGPAEVIHGVPVYRTDLAPLVDASYRGDPAGRAQYGYNLHKTLMMAVDRRLFGEGICVGGWKGPENEGFWSCSQCRKADGPSRCRLAVQQCVAIPNRHQDGQIFWRCPECGDVERPCR